MFLTSEESQCSISDTNLVKGEVMKSFNRLLRNEDGSAIILALMILVLLTVIGIAGSNSTRTEMKIASNDKLNKITFYAAEAARAYVRAKVDLYGPDNITVGSSHWFPNYSDPYVQAASEADVADYTLNTFQSFIGSIAYTGFSDPPRGSGYEAGKFRSHRYTMTCTGNGPRNSSSDILAGFYRIGF